VLFRSCEGGCRTAQAAMGVERFQARLSEVAEIAPGVA
jgi:hypothetical protein